MILIGRRTEGKKKSSVFWNFLKFKKNTKKNIIFNKSLIIDGNQLVDINERSFDFKIFLPNICKYDFKRILSSINQKKTNKKYLIIKNILFFFT